MSCCSTSTPATRSRPGKKSLAYALTYQDDNRTLTDKNAAKIRKKIIGAARHRLNAELRA